MWGDTLKILLIEVGNKKTIISWIHQKESSKNYPKYMCAKV